MKKVKLISLIIVLVFILSGCGCSLLNGDSTKSKNIGTGGVPNLDGFVTLKSTDIQGNNQPLSKEYVIYDKETKVEYMIIATSDNKITITPLYGDNGKPKLYNK